MAVVGKFRAGKGSRVSVLNTALNKSVWDLTIQGDDLDTVTFECGGVDQGEIGITGIDWNMGANWDAGKNNLDSPPGLYPRSDLGLVQFYENLADNVSWSLPNNRVLSSKNGAEARGLVTFNTSGKINGPGFSMPTGNA